MSLFLSTRCHLARTTLSVVKGSGTKLANKKSVFQMGLLLVTVLSKLIIKLANSKP